MFAQKKTKAEIEAWNAAWDEASKEWQMLKTRVENLIAVHDGSKQKMKLPTIRDLSPDEETAIVRRMLKAYITNRDDAITADGLIKKYRHELENVCAFDKDTQDTFGYVNTWWVFGEVALKFPYSVFLAEAESIGYKRSKRGEKPTPNDLYRADEYGKILVDDNNHNTILDYIRDIRWD